MAGANPLVSVIVPAYNGAGFIAEALNSILVQSPAPLETLVIDDGSTDDTARIVAGFGGAVTYVKQANQGPAAARNHGLALARGALIAFLDADDRWPDGKLERQVAALTAAPERPLVMGHFQFLRQASGRQQYEVEAGSNLAMLVGCLVARREVFDQVGGFDPALRMSEDTDWFIRAREAGLPMLVLPETVLHYRRHAGSLTNGITTQDLPLAQVLKRSLDRRRQQAQSGAGDHRAEGP